MKTLILFLLTGVLALAQPANSSVTYNTGSLVVSPPLLRFTSPKALANATDPLGLVTLQQLGASNYVPGFKLSASGLVVTVGAGVLNFADGTSAAVASQTVNLTPSITNYIVIRLDTNKTAHALYRAFDSASVVVGTVVADDSSATSINQITNVVVPNNPSYPFSRSLRNGYTNRLDGFGDSLMDGAGSGTPYWSLLTDSTFVANGCNLPGLSTLTSTKHALGGSAYQIAMLNIADNFSPGATGSGWSADHPNQAIAITSGYNSEEVTAIAKIGENPTVETTPSDVLIAIGTNDDARNMERLEAIGCFWQRRGSRVTFSPGIRRFDGNSSATATNANWKVMCDAHGFTFADTDAYYYELVNNYLNFDGPNPTYSDSIHLTQTGQIGFASCLQTAMAPVNYQTSMTGDPYARRVLVSNSNISPPHANACYNWPYSSGTSLTNSLSPTYCPRTIFGGYTGANAVVVMPTGSYVQMCFPATAGIIWGMFENRAGDNCTFTTTLQGSTVISSGTVTGNVNPYQFVGLINLATSQSFFPANTLGFVKTGLPVSTGFRLNITNGTAKLVGVFFESPKMRQLPLSRLTATGAGPFYDEAFDGTTGSRVWATDTINDRITLPTGPCNGLLVFLRMGPRSGVIKFGIDNITTTFTSFDTYQNNGAKLILPVQFFPGAYPNTAGSTSANIRLDNNYGEHFLRMQLVGTNVNCNPSIAGERLLTVAGAWEEDMR